MGPNGAGLTENARGTVGRSRAQAMQSPTPVLPLLASLPVLPFLQFEHLTVNVQILEDARQAEAGQETALQAKQGQLSSSRCPILD